MMASTRQRTPRPVAKSVLFNINISIANVVANTGSLNFKISSAVKIRQSTVKISSR